MKNIVKIILKLAPLQGYRRQIGLAAMIAAGVVTTLTQADMLTAVPWLSAHAGQLAAVGTYVAIVGAAYKDDPK